MVESDIENDQEIFTFSTVNYRYGSPGNVTKEYKDFAECKHFAPVFLKFF